MFALTIFTQEDYRRLLNIFDMPFTYLENNIYVDHTDNLLYRGMLETEFRQIRLQVDFYTEIMLLVSAVEDLESKIETELNLGNPTNIRAVEITGEVRTEFGQNKDGSYGGGTSSTKQLINKNKVQIQKLLGIYRRRGYNKIC
jgi:hypothetical protein